MGSFKAKETTKGKLRAIRLREGGLSYQQREDSGLVNFQEHPIYPELQQPKPSQLHIRKTPHILNDIRPFTDLEIGKISR